MYKILTASLFTLALWLSCTAQAVIVVTVNEGESRAQPIAIAQFLAEASDPEDVASIVSNDLTLSGFFAPIDRQSIQDLGDPKPGEPINFATWQAAGADNLVIGRVVTRNGKRVIEFELIDTVRQERLLAKRVPMPNGAERRAAHRVSDLIYEKLTGNRGYFRTQLAYVVAKRVGDEQLFSLNVSDIDGHGAKSILDSAEPILSPTWSPNGKSLAYVSFERDKPEVWEHNIYNNRRRVVAERPGINGAPAFSPDGRNLAVAMSYNGSLDIYILSLATGRLQRMTRDPGIDTEPTWSPDGNKIAFTSDRSGRQQVYELDLNSREVRRVTFTGKENARPRYSPDGSQLVLEHFDDGYKIGVLDLDTTNLKVITSGGLDESPSFSPEGSVVVYARSSNDGTSLVITPVSGESGGFQIQSSGESVREAAWSPYLNK